MPGPKKPHRPSEASEHAARSLRESFTSQHTEHSIAAIARASVRRDLEESRKDTPDSEEDDTAVLSRTTTSELPPTGSHLLSSSARRKSYISSSQHMTLGLQPLDTAASTGYDRGDAIEEERLLLEDNNLLPAGHSQRRRESHRSARSTRSLRDNILPARTAQSISADERNAPTESSPLLVQTTDTDIEALPGGEPGLSDDQVDKLWQAAINDGQIHTTWQREFKTVVKYSLPLILTFLLQVSLTLTSVFTVGHIGEKELGAVSLGSMTANITGYAVYYGMITSLDTLCAQAYGSGKKTLVGLQLQRMVYFLWLCTVPIAALWLAAPRVLQIVVPDKEIAHLAGLYLRVLVAGAPAYALFESATRYVQAQGKFEGTMYVLLIAAPINMFLHWLFVWRLEWGFIGCPIAVVVTENLLPLLLFIYVRFFGGGMDCWPGFTRSAFRNWGPMIRLAIPGLLMILAEMITFEILVLASAQISSTHLAANTVLQSVSVLAYQIPYPVGIAVSTRVANLIGASLPEEAKKTGRVAYIMAATIGTCNMILLSTLRNYIPKLFSNEDDVIALAAKTLPVNAAFQLFDALAGISNGILRGLGRQEFGGYLSLAAYYGVGMPVSFGTAFGLHWNLYGLWAGPAIALFIQSVVTAIYIWRISWQKASEEAARRNEAD